MTIQECIQKAMAETGLTIQQVAESGNISRQTVAKALKGLCEDSRIDTKAKIARGFGMRLIHRGNNQYEFIDAPAGESEKQNYEFDTEITQGLQELLSDEALCRLMRVSESEIETLKTIRFRIDRKPSKETYLRILDAIRNVE